MKQTAVEWLVDELLEGKLLMPSLIEQAKEMEKQQIIDARENGFYSKENWKGDSEQYYNETFNK